jgi:DNA invertase Pin-like site-specific DNA recombinase
MTTTNGLRTAVIWARVSTKGQKEISPDTQIAQCQQLLKSKGYVATKIFNIDFCSLDLSISKEFQQLQHMIQAHEIDAVACYDRDRLMADGIDRLVFLSQLKEFGVDLLVCNGAPVMDTDEGQIVELALALGKKRSVLRARTGSRDGLRARVTLKGKPANHHKVFGYDWNTSTETLTPNADYPTVKLVFDLALSGAGYDKICHELQNKGTLSPRGSTWAKANVSNIIHNTIYAGRYMGLRSSIIRSDKPGYKLQHRPESEWHWIKEVKIIESPITWEQREALLQQIQRHIKLSSRNANRQYLLRGMISSDEYAGRQGKHIKYHGRSRGVHGYGYICEVDGKQSHYISGEKLEEAVKSRIRQLFATSQDKFWKRLNEINRVNRPQLEAELKAQMAKLSKVLQHQAQLEERKMDGLEQRVYDLMFTKYHTQQVAIEAGIKETQSQIASADNAKELAASFEGIKEHFMDVLNGCLLDSDGNVTDIMFDSHPEYNTRWRQLLEALDVKIHIGGEFTIETEEQTAERHKGETPVKFTDGMPEWDEAKLVRWDESDNSTFFDVLNFPPYDTLAYMTLRGGLLLQPQKIANIASAEPWSVCL